MLKEKLEKIDILKQIVKEIKEKKEEKIRDALKKKRLLKI